MLHILQQEKNINDMFTNYIKTPKLIAENKKLSIKVDKIKEKEVDHLINHLLTQILEINGFKVR